jgi:Ca2+-transporting ATPase
VMLVSIGFGLGQPLSAMQLLWINLISDIFPGLALAMEADEPDIMQRQPRAVTEELITPSNLRRMLQESAVITGGSVASHLYARWRYGSGMRANSHTFNTLVLAQLFHAISCRSDHHSIYSRGRLPDNPALNWAIGASVAAQLLAMFVPGLRNFLGLSTLSVLDTAVIATGALGPVLINEGLKQQLVPTGTSVDIPVPTLSPTHSSEAGGVP